MWNIFILFFFRNQKMTPQKIFAIVGEHVPQFRGKKMYLKPLKGLTNLTYQVSVQDSEQSIVFRKFCPGIDRSQQNKTYQMLFGKNVAPKCYYACEQYRLQQFITQGIHPPLELYQNEQIVSLMIQKMKQFHKIQPYQNKNPQMPQNFKVIFDETQLQKMLATKPHDKLRQCQQKNFSLLLSKLKTFLKQKKSREMLWKNLACDSKIIRFCHNDLNNYNIFIIKKESNFQVKFIDFQYASYNYIAYDIANLLNESTIDYSKVQYPGFQIVRKITIQEVRTVAEFYPESYDGLSQDIMKCLCLCNLYWACWSVIMAKQVPNGIFGTCAHGLMRLQMFQEYYKEIVKK